ncbi:hypothetical protein [Pseudomonas triticicola]|uniref:hypothetical protein n=1 Tax=Pseudomonas triticicola TaxID=2842345 RepID=UPI003EBE066A
MIVRQLSNVAILSLPAAASIERKPFNQQNLACSSVADVLRGDFKQPSSTASSCHSLHYGDGNACWSLNTAIEAIGQQCENPESQDSGFFYACDLIPSSLPSSIHPIPAVLEKTGNLYLSAQMAFRQYFKQALASQ